MIALQEELDWHCYQLYGLLSDDLRYTGDDLPELALGQRAFEIVMARQMAKGELETTWFERHGSTPITEIPTHWPAAYRKLVERRIKLIETNKEIALIEKPEYKRRWNDRAVGRAGTAGLEELAAGSARNAEVPQRHEGQPGTDHDGPDGGRGECRCGVPASRRSLSRPTRLQRGRTRGRIGRRRSGPLPADPAVQANGPAEAGNLGTNVGLATARRQRSNHETHETHERRQSQNRRIRHIDSDSSDSFRVFRVFRGSKSDGGSTSDDGSKSDGGSIPVPPKYATADFLKTDYWRLRGKLDVPKERWISYPHCSTDSDPTLVVGWAGWNHLEQATALVAYYDARKREGWDAKRLTPLLAGLDQLLPWIHQWHPEVDPEYGETAGQSFQTMLEHDAHELGLTLDDVRQWTPPEKQRKTPTARKKKAE